MCVVSRLCDRPHGDRGFCDEAILPLPLTSEQRTKLSYERHPYPSADLGRLIAKGGELPPVKWMNAVGRPGRAMPRRVLVAGCGTGVEAFILRRRLPRAEIVAVDFSPRSIAVAERFQRTVTDERAITFQVADLTDPNLGKQVGGEFDLITCHGVLSYIPEPKRVLENLARCVSPGGALYLGVNGEAHPATRLRPWLEGYGLAVDALRDERRLRELLGLWDALNDDGSGELATMSASYLGGDVCGPHFNNWSLARWRSEANGCGWEVAGTDILAMALQLAVERGNHRVLYPAGSGALAARLDQARPAGFHRIMLRRAKAGALDVVAGGQERRLCWSGLYSVRFDGAAAGRTTRAVFRCPSLRLRFDWTLTRRQAAALQQLMAPGAASRGRAERGRRSDADQALCWLWNGIGAVAVDQAEP